jgi:four helix bundle protein
MTPSPVLGHSDPVSRPPSPVCPADKINFYYVARGSVTETQSHLEYGRRVGYLAVSDATTLSEGLDQVHAEINRVISSLKRSGR